MKAVKKPKDELSKVWRAVKKAEIERLVKGLVRIPSHKDVPTREREVALFLKEFLEDEGIETRLRVVEKNRPNLIAVVKGSGRGKLKTFPSFTEPWLMMLENSSMDAVLFTPWTKRP